MILNEQLISVKKVNHIGDYKLELKWNDYDLCFPVADLYENRIIN